MVNNAATTVEACLDELPPDRRQIITAVRSVVLKHLPKGYEEAMGFGMINYCVPLARHADTYNKQPLCCVAPAAQKNYNAIYPMDVYGDGAVATQFKEGFAKAGKTSTNGKKRSH